ncbi:hypothetical protein AAG747_01720 [Rapidithrix thailandica]|uniref:Uncharacterized protein n=1 Tax=Rapidithrix thailandica TaxID=413964 RepID=A0AAW9S4D4_9BACT
MPVLLALFLVMCFMPQMAKAQSPEFLSSLHKQKLIEVDLDTVGNSIIHTHCQQAVSKLYFVFESNQQSGYFALRDTLYQILEIQAGESDTEILLRYQDGEQNPEMAILYFDLVTREYLMMIFEQELAFVKEDEMKRYPLIDECP